MDSSDFVHLHCHSTYSLLEALPSPEQIVLRAKELGQKSVGLADKGYTYGLIEFYKAAKKHDIKPILGLETYVAVRSRHDKESGVDTKRYPLTLLAETKEGYENLLQLATQASLEGMYYKPRVDEELLKKYGNGLIALSGPIGGTIPQAALVEDGDRIAKLTESYKSFFGEENLYFELMDLPAVSGQAEVNQQLIRWGKELNVPTVVTCNSHYCRAEDAEAHDVLLCIQKNARIDDPRRFSMRDSDFSMRPMDELEKAFAHVPEALEVTSEIAQRCNVDFNFGTYHIPRFPVPDKTDEVTYLRKLTEEGFSKLYPDKTKEQTERMEYELSIIEQMGFSGYFLIVQDFINAAKEKEIAVGPGRGSAAGSLVSYCLGITALDPIEHGLIFERFLNPARVSMPDVDVDFADISRDEVLQYVREKYGEDHVVQICTFGTLAARAAVKDVGRAFGVPFLEMNTLAKLIPERPGTTLEEAMETQEMKAAYDSNETYKKIIDTAFQLEKKARHVSVHACGVIITEEPTVKYTALQKAPKDDTTIITQSSAKPLESLGLLKMDFLGLTNLTVIQTTLKIIERTKGEKINIGTIPVDNKKAFRLLQKGDTTGVFQLESGGMRRYLKQLKPTEFEDITAMVSLYRPGPMEWIPSFIKRKHGKEKVKYIHDDLMPILKPTHGIGIYQEQILEIARVFAGYSLGEADLLRRAIGKKIKSELDAQHDNFVEGATKKGYEKKLANTIFNDVIMPFAGYGFNKSHAAGYARIAYETAYLKANYPIEFMSALLSSDAQRTDRVMIEIDECRVMGIKVLPPDINKSLRHFTALPKAKKDEESEIRFGLTAIKGIGDSSVMQIITAREEGGEFESIEDFAKRVPAKVLNKKSIEALAKAGALDSLGERGVLIEHFSMISEYAKSCGDISTAQTDLFSGMEDSVASKIEFPKTEPASLQQKLIWEKETLGMYVSNHPLAGLRKYIKKKAQLIGELTEKDAGKNFKIAGIQEGIKKIMTRKGDAMGILFLEDPTGRIEVTLFPKIYAEIISNIEDPEAFLVVEGAVDMRGGQLQMRASSVKCTKLSRIIKNAKDSNFFDEEEAEKGLTVSRKTHDDDEEELELVDEEGDVIAGEKAKVEKVAEAETAEKLGSITEWITRGMKLEKEMAEIMDIKTPSVTDIQPYTIVLPDRAPKTLLIELKNILQKFPGKGRVQLKIGDQIISLPITISTSTILDNEIENVIKKYSS